MQTIGELDEYLGVAKFINRTMQLGDNTTVLGKLQNSSIVLLGVGWLPAGHAQDVGQRTARKTLHIDRLDVAQQAEQTLVLKVCGRVPSIDPIVHVDHIYALVHDPGMVVMVVRKEVQFTTQFLGDQRV